MTQDRHTFCGCIIHLYDRKGHEPPTDRLIETSDALVGLGKLKLLSEMKFFHVQ
jgi:hypothetical protein